jgi:hypothetical protein
MPRITDIVVRQGTLAQWLAAQTAAGNVPILNSGELAWETDTKKIRVGDGTTLYGNLPYEGSISPIFSGAVVANEGAVFNEIGGNYDFRVEGDTDQNLLFVDASADDVGIGTAIPAAKLHVAGDSLFENLSYRRFTASTAVSTHFRKYYDIIHYANSTSSVAGSLRIEIPITTSTMWSMDVVIVEYDGVNATSIKTTNLTITGYTTNNLNRSVWTNNPSRISQVRFGRKSGGGSTIILIDPVSAFRYPKAYIKEINTHHSNETTFANSANYALTITTNETDFLINGTITNAEFLRDDKLVNTFGDQVVAGNKTLNGNIVINEDGANFDFRVEGDTDENLLSVDASLDRVGIGILVPQAKLDVRGSLYANDVVTLGSGSIPFPRSPIELLNKTNIAELQINKSYTFPTSDGTSGQVLVTDGSGVLSWESNNLTRGSFILSSDQSIFTVNDGYVIGGLDVYYNGIKLLTGTDYTATNGTSFTLTNVATSGDVVEYLALSAASMDANTVRGSVAATNGQTVFSISGGYTIGNLDVFLNGMKLVSGTDYTATNGTSITLTSAASSGDILEYNAYGLVVASNGLQKTGDTMTGNLTIGSGYDIIFDDTIIDNNALDISVADGRLTLESGVAVSTTNQISKTILYYTPHKGNRIALYDTVLSKWRIHNFSELSLSLSGLAANTNFDIFAYDNNGTLTLESLAWSNNTTRSTEITRQDGVYVRNGSINKRYLGTIRTTSSTGQCEDSLTKRFVWNIHNTIIREIRNELTSDWTYGTNTWRAFNNTNYYLEIVCGIAGDNIELTAGALYTMNATTITYYAIGIANQNSATPVFSSRVSSNWVGCHMQIFAHGFFTSTNGYQYFYPVENRITGGVPAIYGSSTTGHFGGIMGSWRC